MKASETLTAAADKLEGLLDNPLARAPMDPPIGRALVALLRRCVSHAELAQEARLPQTQLVLRALDVARAILGEATS